MMNRLGKCMLAMLFSLGTVATARAQDFHVKGSSSFQIIKGSNTSTATEDRIGVMGVSTPSPYWGVGGEFQGGYAGVRGSATLYGSGSRIGVHGTASGGTSNYAILTYSPTGSGSYAGYFGGDVYVSGTLNPSDAKLKLNVQDLPNGTLAQVMRLRPKRYKYRTTLYPKLSLPQGEHAGLIAQDVANVFPQVVTEVIAPPDDSDKSKPQERFLSVSYVEVIPHLIKAMQEQQAQIDALKAEVARLK